MTTEERRQTTPPRVGQVMIVKVQTPLDGGYDCLIYDESRERAHTMTSIAGPLRDLVDAAVKTHGVSSFQGGKVFFRAKVNRKRVHLLEPVAMEDW